ncbi:sigma-70 family RNA polymerase sigma factor [Pseudonocardiaceae bacterium YIM PH 21723]|nr:sigma-70 family RNA polymerase sigma factor [Pseudonocardiaceae bacterium YIM PH 21723]
MTAQGPTPVPVERDRDEQLISALYEQFGGILFATALRLTGNDRQWAEDVVQETLFRAWRNAGKLDRQPGLLQAWLLTVARRIVIDTRRSRGARPTEVGPLAMDVAAGHNEEERMLSALVVSEALSQLTPEHREALQQTYLQDRTVNEAAEYLGISPGTVKSRVYYALRALRRVLGESEGIR